jgi:signal transduction histidine kinase
MTDGRDRNAMPTGSNREEADEPRRQGNADRDLAEVRATLAERAKLRAELERNEAHADREQAQTERDRAEAGRTRAERERAEIELLMAVLAHDLRNPLGTITISAQRLRRTGKFERAEDRTAVERIASSAARVTRMVDQLLDFERIRKAQGIPVELRPTNLGVIARQVVDELCESHPHRQLTLQVSGNVEGVWDPDRMAQVVDNLIANGLQYGALDTPVETAVSDQGPTVLISVRNQGVAIDEEPKGRIFDPFRRVSERTPGLGLGLFIVQQIVLAHRGRIDFQSSDVDGTVFTVELPRSPSLGRVA